MTVRKSQDSSDHEHAYELRGGPTFWAECADPDCREKFSRGHGVVVGSRAKVTAALAAA